MIASTARKLASQANGKLSRGPVTPEGKAISRTNSFKHGLTGDGIVLPQEDAAEVAKRFNDLEAQFHPATPMGQILVHRLAFLSVRLERCAEQEAAYLSEKIRHAQADHDEQRQAEVDRLLSELARQPALSVRKLLRTPEGIDALIGAWGDLRSDLARPGFQFWTAQHCERAHQLTGRKLDDIPISAIQELSRAIWGDFSMLNDQDGAGLDVEARRAWARDRLIEGIDEEIAALRDCRENLDLDVFEQDRAEAGRRALFDTSKPAILARRYEAAAERGLFRALKDLRAVEKAALDDPQVSPASPIGPLGSFFPEPEVISESVAETEEEQEESAPDDLSPILFRDKAVTDRTTNRLDQSFGLVESTGPKSCSGS